MLLACLVTDALSPFISSELRQAMGRPRNWRRIHRDPLAACPRQAATTNNAESAHYPKNRVAFHGFGYTIHEAFFGRPQCGNSSTKS